MTRIGLDFHGVIIRPSTRRPEDDRTLAAVVERQQEQEGMFEGVTTLIEATHGRVWVVSKAGPGWNKWLGRGGIKSDFASKQGCTPTTPSSAASARKRACSARESGRHISSMIASTSCRPCGTSCPICFCLAYPRKSASVRHGRATRRLGQNWFQRCFANERFFVVTSCPELLPERTACTPRARRTQLVP